jgi:hypothetical protein
MELFLSSFMGNVSNLAEEREFIERELVYWLTLSFSSRNTLPVPTSSQTSFSSS